MTKPKRLTLKAARKEGKTYAERTPAERAELRTHVSIILRLEHPCEVCTRILPVGDACRYCERGRGEPWPQPEVSAL